MSRTSGARAGEEGREGLVGRALAGAWHPTNSASARAGKTSDERPNVKRRTVNENDERERRTTNVERRTSCFETLFGEFVQRLVDLGEIGRIGLCSARFAGARHEDRVALLAERD